jgi:hypothetical protein
MIVDSEDEMDSAYPPYGISTRDADRLDQLYRMMADMNTRMAVLESRFNDLQSDFTSFVIMARWIGGGLLAALMLFAWHILSS